MNSRFTFLKTVLEKPHQFEWSIQGFGMLRLYVSPGVRLHIWDPDLGFRGVSTIHTHPWDFTSEILVGSLTDRVFGVDGATFPSTHNMQQIRCGAGACGVGAAHPVALHVAKETTYTAGQSYALAGHKIHESLPTRGTVSIITRTFKADTEHANVYFPLNTEWVSSEPRAATFGEVAHMCDAALRRLESDG